MANSLGTNPVRIDTAVKLDFKEGVLVMGMEWADDALAAGGALTAGDDLEMVINGCPVSITASSTWPVAWTRNFSQPILIFGINVTKIDGGTLYIWKG